MGLHPDDEFLDHQICVEMLCTKQSRMFKDWSYTSVNLSDCGESSECPGIEYAAVASAHTDSVSKVSNRARTLLSHVSVVAVLDSSNSARTT